jgi:hypothetical protein
MNLDNPESGPLFPYAIEAALQRTVFEFERTLAQIGEEQGEAAMWRFVDLAAGEQRALLPGAVPCRCLSLWLYWLREVRVG